MPRQVFYRRRSSIINARSPPESNVILVSFLPGLQLLFYCNGAYKIADYFERVAKRKYKREEIMHGSAFMLTPQYFWYYTGLYDKTFLYEEETLLYFYCKRCGLKEKKINNACVMHKGGQSTKLFYNGRPSKNERYILKSYKYVLYESICDFVHQKETKS